MGFLGTDDISFTDTEAAKAAAGKQFSFLCAPMYILFVIIGFIFSGCSNLNMTYSPILLQELGMILTLFLRVQNTEKVFS